MITENVSVDFWLAESKTIFPATQKVKKNACFKRDEKEVTAPFSFFKTNQGQIIKLFPGKLLEIGRGASGRVKFAQDCETGIKYALKIMDVSSESRLYAFQREVTTLKQLDRHVESFIENQKGYVLTSYIEGNEFGDSLLFTPLNKMLDVQFLIDMCMHLKKALQALADMHSRHILHRDIKPNNLLSGIDGSLHFIDFGYSTLISDANEVYHSSKKYTLDTYSAPELLNTQDFPYSIQTDLYALGVCFYHLIALIADKYHSISAKPMNPFKAVHMDTMSYLSNNILDPMLSAKAKDRPSSQTLIESLNSHIQKLENQAKTYPINPIIDVYGPFILKKAVETQNIEWLEAKYASMTLQTLKELWFHAVLENKQPMFEFLIKHKIAPDARDKTEATPLHIAVSLDHFVALRAIFHFYEVHPDLKPDRLLNARNILEETPLHFALSYYNQASISILIGKGVNPKSIAEETLRNQFFSGLKNQQYAFCLSILKHFPHAFLSEHTLTRILNETYLCCEPLFQKTYLLFSAKTNVHTIEIDIKLLVWLFSTNAATIIKFILNASKFKNNPGWAQKVVQIALIFDKTALLHEINRTSTDAISPLINEFLKIETNICPPSLNVRHASNLMPYEERQPSSFTARLNEALQSQAIQTCITFFLCLNRIEDDLVKRALTLGLKVSIPLFKIATLKNSQLLRKIQPTLYLDYFESEQGLEDENTLDWILPHLQNQYSRLFEDELIKLVMFKGKYTLLNKLINEYQYKIDAIHLSRLMEDREKSEIVEKLLTLHPALKTKENGVSHSLIRKAIQKHNFKVLPILNRYFIFTTEQLFILHAYQEAELNPMFNHHEEQIIAFALQNYDKPTLLGTYPIEDAIKGGHIGLFNLLLPLCDASKFKNMLSQYLYLCLTRQEYEMAQKVIDYCNSQKFSCFLASEYYNKVVSLFMPATILVHLTQNRILFIKDYLLCFKNCASQKSILCFLHYLTRLQSESQLTKALTLEDITILFRYTLTFDEGFEEIFKQFMLCIPSAIKFNPFHVVASISHFDEDHIKANFFHQLGYDINESNAMSLTPLMLSIEYLNASFFEWLINQQGIDLDKVDDFEQNALIKAVRVESTEMVLTLLEHNADASRVDAGLKNAFDYAAISAFSPIIEALSASTKSNKAYRV